jgi:putative zinc finger/helix-turn-helix YgiT family protein
MKEVLNSVSTQSCPSCNSSRIVTNYDICEFTYGVGEKAVKLKAEVPLLSCPDCGFEYTDYRADEAKHDAVCRYLGVMPPFEILALRKGYNVTRARFAEITGIGEASIARWETGELIQNASIDNYLYLLSFTENLEKLQKRRMGSGRVIYAEDKFRALPKVQLEEIKREAAGFRL